jgi:Lipocalin-like domain
MSLTTEILGVWRLQAFESQRDGQPVRYPFGIQAAGVLVYSADGTMSGQLMRPGRPVFASATITGGTDAELRAAAMGYVAYAGTFEVDEARALVLHRVTMSLFPNLIGTVQERRATLENGTLELRTPEGARLVWVRSDKVLFKTE